LTAGTLPDARLSTNVAILSNLPSWATTTDAAAARTNLGVTVASNLPAPYSGAAATNSLLTADGAGGSAFVATLPKLTLGAGAATNPSFVLTGSSLGIYQRIAGELTFTDGTEPQMRYFTNNLMFNSDFLLAWGNSTTQPVTGDTYLLRDTTNTLASRNGTNAQTYNIYNTYSNSTNYERGRIAWTNNVLTIGTEKGSGGGTARALEFQTDGIGRLTITSAGLFQFGGASSGFPALKRAGSVLQVRFADDLAYTTLEALHRLQGTAPTNSTDTGTAGDMRYDTNNFLYICVSNNVWRRTSLTNW